MKGRGQSRQRRGLSRLLSVEGWWIVALAILLAAGGPLFGAWRLASHSRSGVQASSSMEAQSPAGAKSGRSVNAQRAAVDSQVLGASALSHRTQQALALVCAASLRLAKERALGRLSRDTTALYAGILEDRINPPGLTSPPAGSSSSAVILASRDGVFVLRYQPHTSTVEVVSLTNLPGQGSGPALLVRIPDDPALFGDAPGFYTRAVIPGEEHTQAFAGLPPAFADPVRLAGAGWRVSPLPGTVNSRHVQPTPTQMRNTK